jgi:hypothetical protein
MMHETCTNTFSVCIVRDTNSVVKLLLFIIFSGSVAQRGLWPPRSRGCLIKHNAAPQSIELLWTSDQHVAEISTWQHTHQTNIHAPGGIRTHDRSRRAAVDLRLRPRAHWDRQQCYQINNKNINLWKLAVICSKNTWSSRGTETWKFESFEAVKSTSLSKSVFIRDNCADV